MARMLLSIPSPSSMKMFDLWSSSSWWEEINESRNWQDGIFFTLCGFYALVSAIALIQLIRIEIRVPEYGWTTQKVFHLMNYIVNGVRAVVFGFHMQVFNLHPKVSIWVLLEVPGLLFFLVLFWAEIYHQARSLPTDKLKTTYVCVNVGVYVIQFPPTRRLSPLPLLCSFWRDSSTADAASPPATHCHHQQSGSGDLLPLPTSAILPSGDPLTSTILPPSRHQD